MQKNMRKLKRDMNIKEIEEVLSEIFPAAFIGILSFATWQVGKKKFDKFERNFQAVYAVEIKPKVEELEKEGYGLIEKCTQFKNDNIKHRR